MNIAELKTFELLIEGLLEDSLSFKLASENYIESYKAFIGYFETQQEINKTNLIIGINFTYGWMPTIFNFKTKEIDKACEILNTYKLNSMIPNSKQLKSLKELFNNSIVGTSKLMHFIRPDLLPIWDSRVNAYLMRNYNFNKRVNTVSKFEKYIGCLKQIMETKQFDTIAENVRTELQKGDLNETHLSNYRILEQLMFHKQLEHIKQTSE